MILTDNYKIFFLMFILYRTNNVGIMEASIATKMRRSGKRMIEETEKEMEVTTTSSGTTIPQQEITATSSPPTL